MTFKNTPYGYNKELDDQYIIHMERKPWNTKGRLDRLMQANEQGWQNEKPIAYDTEVWKGRAVYFPSVYYYRMPWKYDSAWIRTPSVAGLILASVKKNVVKRKDYRA